MKKKNYFEPTMRFHQLKTASFIAMSLGAEEKEQENPKTPEEEIEGFRTYNGWN